MRNRNLYKLEFVENSEPKSISVIRVDRNYGVQGYVDVQGRVFRRYPPYSIPQYIIKECMEMFKQHYPNTLDFATWKSTAETLGCISETRHGNTTTIDTWKVPNGLIYESRWYAPWNFLRKSKYIVTTSFLVVPDEELNIGNGKYIESPYPSEGMEHARLVEFGSDEEMFNFLMLQEKQIKNNWKKHFQGISPKEYLDENCLIGA